MKYSAGNIFVRFLTIGITILLILIIGVKYFVGHSNSAILSLAASIFIVNLLIVLGYTFAIIRNESLLIEEDAADLAYYLGFSLTVASLAFSFISDIGLDSNADAKSTLVKGSLAQFGAGLLATLIGLSAKIIINSRQTHLASNPEVLYQKFRQEIKGFENSLTVMTGSMDSSIKSACLSINLSAEAAAASMEKLAERLKTSSDSISENLTVDKISTPIAAFANELLKLQSPANNFNTEMGTLIKSVSAITTSLASLNDTISQVKNSNIEEHKSIDGLVEIRKISNELNKANNIILFDQNKALTESNKQLLKFQASSTKVSDSMDIFSSSSTTLAARNGELEKSIQLVDQAIINAIGSLSQLVVSTNDLGVVLNASNDNIMSFNASSAAVSTTLQGTTTVLTEVNNKFDNIPQSIDRTVSSLNNASTTVTRGVNEMNTPLNAASTSITSLNLAISKLSKDIETLSRVIPKSSV